MIAHLFTTWLTDYFNPTTETTAQKKKKKKIPFKIRLLTDNDPGHPRARMEKDNKINDVLMPANTIAILQPMDRVIIWIFESF